MKKTSFFIFCLCSLPFFLFANFFSRVYFYIYNHILFQNTSQNDLFSSFILGIRFDLSTFGFLFSFFILLSFFEHYFHHFIRKIYFSLFFIIFNLSLLFNFWDAAYYPFSGRRSNLQILNMTQDLSTQGFQLLIHYASTTLLSLFIGSLTFFLCSFISSKLSSQKISLKLKILFFPFLAVLIALMIRGGLQKRPLSSAHAFVLPSHDLGSMALNTTFHIIRSIHKKENPQWQFMSDEEMKEIVFKKEKSSLKEKFPQKNVILIILESFSYEYSHKVLGEKSWMPFLDSLIKKSYFFNHAFANGTRTAEVIPSVLGSLPSFMDTPFTFSPFAANPAIGLGHVLKDAGYHTHFFHGAFNGSMGIEQMVSKFGIDHYYGFNEYPNPKDQLGSWGIGDEPFFQFFGEKMSGFSQPFFAGFLSLSSHNPYTVPESFKEGTLDSYENLEEKEKMRISMKYSDNALSLFFQKFEHEPWFQNSIFVFTADHAGPLIHTPSFATLMGRYRIPLLFYIPSSSFQKDSSEFVQQLDISHTLLDLLNLQDSPLALKIPRFGKSVFIPSPSSIINHQSGYFWMLQEFLGCDKKADHSFSNFLWNEDFTQKETLENKECEKRLKAYLQYYSQVLNP